jgi:DNA topoisomerase-1
MDKAAAKSDYAPAGVSIRNGPVTEDPMDVDEPLTNGHAKRKARTSTSKAVNYKDDGSDGESDDVPMVCPNYLACFQEDYHYKLPSRTCP